jgi:hypothetical protein
MDNRSRTLSAIDGQRERLNTLWIGGELTYLERVCLRSATRHGHHVVLYTYDGVEPVPPDVELRDGREVLPDKWLVRHKASRSWALPSNMFRYRLMEHGLGTWIDADVYFIKPLPAGCRFIFGWESLGAINGAVLRIPADSDLLKSLVGYAFGSDVIPPWWRATTVEAWLRHCGERGWTASELPWGSFGPRAITHFVKLHQLETLALPTWTFYPIHYSRAQDFFEPAVDIHTQLHKDTVAVHLWNECIKRLKTRWPPPGSFVDQICAENGIG